MPLSPPLVLEVGIVLQVPTPSALPHTWTFKWVYKELGGATNRDTFGTVSGLPLGSPGTKSHLDVAPVEWRRIYYMGIGGGFPRVRAVVSQVSPKLPMACPSTKGAPECELTNLLVGLMQV
jgi:hypothetical protein